VPAQLDQQPFIAAAAEGERKQPREYAHVTGTKEVMGSVKAAKAAARGFRESGAKPREAAKAALTATGAVKREKQKPKRKKPDSHTDADDGPGYKAPRSSSVYAGAVLILEKCCGCYNGLLATCHVLKNKWTPILAT
jgi:hypothetical protein